MNRFIQFNVKTAGQDEIVNCLIKYKKDLPNNYFTDRPDLITIADPDKEIFIIQSKLIETSDCWGLITAFKMKLIDPEKIFFLI